MEEKTLWKCIVCGEILEGPEKPLKCPVCGASGESIIAYEPEAPVFTSTQALNLLIIGSGVAAFQAAVEARKRNAHARITVISREPYLPYFRPTVTKKLSLNGTAGNSLIKPQSFYDEQNINMILKTAVTRIDPAGKTVSTADGQSYSYDRLLLATGAKAFVPPIPGADLPQVITLREYTDAERLHALLDGKKAKIVVIGGGLLGLETAWGLIRLGHTVTVAEALPTILPRQLDAEGAPMLAKRINAHCRMICGVCVDEITADKGAVRAVKLKDGTVLEADAIIISAGIRSHAELAQNAGIECSCAIVVNDRMETSVPDVFAAGDCAICCNTFDGLWETAMKQGQTAGANMVGDTSVRFTAKKAGATFFAFGTTLFSIGDLGFKPGQPYAVITAKDEIRNTYRKYFFLNGNLCGGVLLGDVTLTPQLLKGVTETVTSDEAFDLGLKA